MKASAEGAAARKNTAAALNLIAEYYKKNYTKFGSVMCLSYERLASNPLDKVMIR